MRAMSLHGVAITAILLLHAGMIGWIAWRTSPNANEIAHLPAGIYTWTFGNFDVYSVNPPLTRLIASAPVMFCAPKTDWTRYCNHNGLRSEWLLADDFIRANEGRAICRYFFYARLALVPVSVLGALTCFFWARELYGLGAGYIALCLWCFSPNILSWAACINPDLAATASGVVAVYACWRWLRQPAWHASLVAGTAVGVALLTKLTWVLVLIIVPVLWLVWTCGSRRSERQGWRSEFCQLLAVLSVGVLVLNAGYLFVGSFQRLGDYSFVSQTLAGVTVSDENWGVGNRFRGSVLGGILVPFPRDYVAGIDLQKFDFEKTLDSYLLGEWSEHGWWWYYAVAAGVKIPAGTWMLLVLAIYATRQKQPLFPNADDRFEPTWRDTFVLLFPALFLLMFVSAQTGFSRHFRYVLPILPFFFVWISCTARWLRKQAILGKVAMIFLAWSVASSMSVFPHSMSYFNELAGGPSGGHRILLDSNLDWGQDLCYLKEWAERHTSVRPLHVDCFGHNAFPKALDIGPVAPVANNVNVNLANSREPAAQLSPGWHAMSIHRVHKTYPHLLDHAPCARINYSIMIFNIPPDVDRLNADYGAASVGGEREQ